MGKAFDSQDRVGDIVIKFPKATDIFKSYGIDFCCQGYKPLATALNELKLDENEVLQKLEHAFSEAHSHEEVRRDWQKAPFTELIDHIVNTHHAFLYKELPELSAMVIKILRVHGVSHAPILFKVHKLFHTLKMELEQHLIKEEEILFPLIKEYEQKPSAALLDKIAKERQEIESEHEEAGDILKELRKITEHYLVPEQGCTTFRLTYQKLEEVESDLFEHIHLENNILFPRLGQ